MRHHSAFLLTAILLWSCIASGAKSDEPVATTAPAEAASRGETAVKVSVFYLTNRKRYQGKPVADTYSGERGEAHFGRCEVEFTPIPIINQVASRMPFYLKSETNLVSLAEQADAPLFWEQLGAAIERTSSGSVVLFVHGYNYGFEWSVPVLANLIRQLGDRIGKANVQVVAHSLGSRGVIFALQRLAFERLERPAIGHLVLFAPDFDSQTFVELLPGLASLAGGITLYASNNDAPLKVSHQLSGYPRLGEAGEYLTLVAGMDTIDVSSIGRYQITGHEYFYFHPLVTADLVELLSTGARAAQRSGLQAKKRDGIRYWAFVKAVHHKGSAATVDD